MKKIVVHIGVVITAEDSCKTDIVMNYALNSLTLENGNGIIKNVEIRGIEIPSVEIIEENLTSPSLENMMMGMSKNEPRN